MRIKGSIRQGIDGISIALLDGEKWASIVNETFVNFIEPYYRFILDLRPNAIINGKVCEKRYITRNGNKAKTLRITLPLFDLVLTKYQNDINGKPSPSDKCTLDIIFNVAEQEEIA